MAGHERDSVLITGASTGIGKASALLLDRSGYRVFAGVRNEQSEEHLIREASGRLYPLILDVTDKEQILGAVKTVTKTIGPDLGLIGLVNNAGIVVSGPIEFLPLNAFRQQLEVNLIGQVAVTQAFLPLIRKARGRIVNMSSTASFFSSPFIGAYSASKHAMVAISDTLRRELKAWGIHVSLLVPGFIDTPIWEKSYQELDKFIEGSPSTKEKYGKAIDNGRRFMDKGRRRSVSPEKVAQAILHALESRKPKNYYFVGIDAFIFGNLTKYLPTCLIDKIVQKVLSGKF